MNNEYERFKAILAADSQLKLKGACNSCIGYVRDCKFCGQKIEILEGKVLDYHAGSAHRCRRRS